MAESFVEKRKRELGITPSAPIVSPIASTPIKKVSQSKVVSHPKSSDFVTQRKMDLGIIPDTRMSAADQAKQKLTESYTAYSKNKNQFAADQLKIAAPIIPKKSAWVSPLENPIVRGAETGLSWLQKPLETVGVIGADIISQTRNLLGSKERTDISGNKFIAKPSESIDLGKKLKEIWTKTKENVPSEVWKGTFPNLNKVKGTSADWTEVINLASQGIPLPTKIVSLPLQAIRSLKLAEEAKVAGQAIKNIPSYKDIGLTSKLEGAPKLITKQLQISPIEAPRAIIPSNLKQLEIKQPGMIKPIETITSNVVSSKFKYTPNELNVIKSHVANPHIDINKVDIPKEFQGKDILYRRDKTDINLKDKPHGAYFSYLNDGKSVYTSHFDAGGTDHWFTPNFKNTLDVKPTYVETNARVGVKKLETSAGVQAALDLSENPDILHYSKDNLETLIKDLDPKLDLSKYHDNWELLEVYGAQLAKEHGYDSISLRVLDDPASSEIVALKNDAFKPLKVKPSETIKPTETVPAIESQAKPQSFFTQLFGEQNIGFTPFSSAKSGRMVSTEQQIVSKPLISSAKGLVESTKQVGRSIYQNTTDYLHPLKKISPETYNTAMDSSRANNIANTIIKDKFVDNEGNVIGNSLDDVMKSVRGLGKKFDDYLVLRHSVDRMNREERVYDPTLNMTPEKASERVKVLEQRYPQLKKAGEEWNKFNTNLLDSGVKEGLIAPEARDAMRSQSPNYAPMRRQFTIGEKLAQPKFSGGAAFSGQKAPIKSVSPTGSIRKIVSPVRSIVEQIQAWKQAELRNRTMQSITKAIQSDPEGMKHIVEIVKKPSTSYKSLDDALREGGSEEFLQQLDGDFKSLFKPAKTGEENIVRAMVNGHPVFIKVHDAEAVKALLGMGSDQSGYILDAMQKLSNATKRGATGILAPMFAVKSLSADVVQAAIQSPNAFKHIAVDLPHALISSIADTLKIPGLKNLAEDFRRSGGEYSALLRGERSLKKSIFELRKEAPLSMGGLVKGTVATVKAPFKALEKVADISENANRMAAFRRAMVGKERTPENVRNAINTARESTTNYSRKGAFAKETEAFVPYSNAAIQGMYRISTAFYHNPIKTLSGVGTLIVAPKLMEYAKFHNDPDYHNIPARERYRNIILSKNADGTFRKQFMPPEYEALGAFITDVLSSVIDKNPQAYKGSLDALVNAWTPPIVSGAAQGITQGGGIEQSLAGATNATVAAPIVSTLANKSFTGAPIEPASVTDRSPKYRYDEKTSGIAKWLGKQTGFSPMKADYIMRAYGGDLVRLGAPLTSDVGAGNVKNTLLKNFIVDPTFTNNLTNDFYGAKQRLSQAYKDNQEVKAQLPTWYDEGLRREITSTAAGSISKRLSILSGDKKNVTTNKLLNSLQKTQQLREIQAKINKIYVDINSRLDKQKVPFK